MSTLRRLAGYVTGIALLTGCNLGLDPPSIVRTPRILAIVAEPPESAPGTDIHFSALTFDPEGRALTHVWRVCFSPARIARGSGLASSVPDDDQCDDVMLTQDGTDAELDGARTAATVALIDSIGSVGGFPAETIALILDTAGLAFEVELDVLDADGNLLVRGYKRVAITRRAAPTTNPPPISFDLGGTLVEPSASAPFGCVADHGQPLRVASDTELTVRPAVPLDGETWLERFPIYDYTGGIREGRENAYYAWFATGGSFSTEITRPPNRETRWRTPVEPGDHTFFLVVRDGHLGTWACSIPVIVE